MNGREVTRVGSSSVNCNRECAERNECQVFGELNPSENSGMTDTVSHKTGAETVTKLTRQFQNGLSESNSNLLYISPISNREDERINPTTVTGHKLWRRANLIGYRFKRNNQDLDEEGEGVLLD